MNHFFRYQLEADISRFDMFCREKRHRVSTFAASEVWRLHDEYRREEKIARFNETKCIYRRYAIFFKTKALIAIARSIKLNRAPKVSLFKIREKINTSNQCVEKKEKTMHDQPVSGIHKFPPHEQHLYGATREDIKTALLLIDRIGRNSSEDPRGDASAAAEIIRRGFKIDVDIQPPPRIIDAAWAIKTWAESHNLKNWQVVGIGPVDLRVQVPIGWTQTSNLVDDGFGHSFTVISSEPANATAEPYAPVYSEPVNAETIKAAAKEWCARACELEAQGCVARNNFVTAGALHSMAKLFREVNI